MMAWEPVNLLVADSLGACWKTPRIRWCILGRIGWGLPLPSCSLRAALAEGLGVGHLCEGREGERKGEGG
jgi:hypothetical protein